MRSEPRDEGRALPWEAGPRMGLGTAGDRLIVVSSSEQMRAGMRVGIAVGQTEAGTGVGMASDVTGVVVGIESGCGVGGSHGLRAMTV